MGREGNGDRSTGTESCRASLGVYGTAAGDGRDCVKGKLAGGFVIMRDAGMLQRGERRGRGDNSRQGKKYAVWEYGDREQGIFGERMDDQLRLSAKWSVMLYILTSLDDEATVVIAVRTWKIVLQFQGF